MPSVITSKFQGSEKMLATIKSWSDEQHAATLPGRITASANKVTLQAGKGGANAYVFEFDGAAKFAKAIFESEDVRGLPLYSGDKGKKVLSDNVYFLRDALGEVKHRGGQHDDGAPTDGKTIKRTYTKVNKESSAYIRRLLETTREQLVLLTARVNELEEELTAASEREAAEAEAAAAAKAAAEATEAEALQAVYEMSDADIAKAIAEAAAEAKAAKERADFLRKAIAAKAKAAAVTVDA